MKRTKLSQRVLPDYTKGEECFNMVSHIVGGGLGIAALVLCVIRAAVLRDALCVVGAVIYGTSLITLYTMSSIYHGLRPQRAKKVMQVLDHCTIYFLIAGTYTPILFGAVRRTNPAVAGILFCVVWGLCALAVTLTAIDLKKYAVFSMICYIGMGWCIVFAAKTVIAAIAVPGLVCLLSGGVVYTVGAVLYGLGKRRRYIHSLFHLFVLAGSILHFFCVFFYAL